MSEQEPTRRERYRRQAWRRIKAAAMAQVHEAGTEAASLNAIARRMSMSAPALYRYFDDRDELFAELAVDAPLTPSQTHEAAAMREASSTSRVRALAHTYRDWAVDPELLHRTEIEATAGDLPSPRRRSVTPRAMGYCP
ncbi:TetR/AcrR family transcriptional regulator [Streptomyces sp. NBC_01235]|uniref:TetR/AcrR family transcriptional regulator n=1 Tax=Streptomyces sp. NBC_01235 TaxID=2903788 RepID=UPI002E1607D2|nr:TetR/AcrR family transcriptional regulator [Streptomyces sp. NBC_01235]